MTALVQVDSLQIKARSSRGESTLIEGIGFHLNRGEVLGVIGESGAGKSTLGLALLGYTRASCYIGNGQIIVAGRELTRLSQHELRRLRGRVVGYVAQSAAATFNPAQRLLKQICEVPIREGLMTPYEARRQATSLFHRLLLPEPEKFGSLYPHQVSGGQLQRAMLAMAMICRPDLLVLDEPTTALDVTTQIEVLRSVRELLRDHDVAAVYISHDIALVAQMASQVMVLRNGRVEECGATQQIVGHPRSTYTRALLDACATSEINLAVADQEEPPLLEIVGMGARYRSGPAVLHGVSLAIDARQTVALVGESGSGKSSLARVIVGLLDPEQGTLAFEGVNIGRLSDRNPELRRRIQLVHQQPDLSLNPHQTVFAAIARPLSVFCGLSRKQRRQRVLELLAMVELKGELAERLPGELSGGQKQRVCIARALAAQPALIVCDEVTASLDPLVALGVIKLLQRIQRETSVSYLMITHDLNLAASFACRVVVMHRGRIVTSGPTSKVLSPPYDEYTGQLMASVPQVRAGWLDEAIAWSRAPVNSHELA